MRLMWRDVDGISTSLTDRETSTLRCYAKGAMVLEIGSAFGYSAIQLADAGAQHVVAIDPHTVHNSLATMETNVKTRCPDGTVTIWVATSEQALPLLADGMFDLVFVDGDHTEQGVAHDVRHAWRLLRPGGTLACHDFQEESCPGVKAALHAWRDPLDLVDTLWLARRL